MVWREGLTDHHLGVYVDHETAVLLCRFVVAVLRRLGCHVVSRAHSLPIAQTEEGKVVSGMSVINPLRLQRHRNLLVHHPQRPRLPVQNRLHRCALGHALGPHGHHDVHRERLAGFDLAHNLARELQWYQVVGARVLFGLPPVATAQEVLVLDVNEVPGSPDRVDVRVLDAPVDRIVPPAHEALFGCVRGVLRKPKCCTWRNPNQIHLNDEIQAKSITCTVTLAPSY